MHVTSIMISNLIINLCTLFCVEFYTTMANRIRNEEVVRLAMEEELDYLDLALLAEHLQADEERMVFRRDFSLDSYTMEQCVQHFRFGYDDLLHFFHLLRIPERVVTEHRVTASGMYMVVCVAVGA